MRPIFERKPLVLEFGCGSVKADREAIGIDVLPAPAVDIVANAYEILLELEGETVDKILSRHFIEHLPDPEQYILKCARVLKHGGLLETTAPHWSNAYFYSDPTHKSFWGLYSMCYFAECDFLRRKVPSYYQKFFRLQDVTLVVRSESTFPVRYLARRSLGSIVNTTRWFQEFYEENLANLLSCYEIIYRMVRL
jgi:SAM-dependent methyltransferase